MGDVAVSLLPQLWPSARVVAQRVVCVGKLVQHPAHALCLHTSQTVCQFARLSWRYRRQIFRGMWKSSATGPPALQNAVKCCIN